ncbi:hypothetical protein OIU76_021671 [Salix suchowensis]|nr:hypothetical protein OIU76_021671 [Salix suchowensis]
MITGDQLAIGKETGRRLGMGSSTYPSSSLPGDSKDESIASIPVDELAEKADGFAGVFPVLTELGLSVIISVVLTSRAIFQRMKNYMAILTVLFFWLAHGTDFFSVKTIIAVTITYIPLDILKFITRYALTGKAWDSLLENKTVFTTKKDYEKGGSMGYNSVHHSWSPISRNHEK